MSIVSSRRLALSVGLVLALGSSGSAVAQIPEIPCEIPYRIGEGPTTYDPGGSGDVRELVVGVPGDPDLPLVVQLKFLTYDFDDLPAGDSLQAEAILVDVALTLKSEDSRRRSIDFTLPYVTVDGERAGSDVSASGIADPDVVYSQEFLPRWDWQLGTTLPLGDDDAGLSFGDPILRGGARGRLTALTPRGKPWEVTLVGALALDLGGADRSEILADFEFLRAWRRASASFAIHFGSWLDRPAFSDGDLTVGLGGEAQIHLGASRGSRGHLALTLGARTELVHRDLHDDLTWQFGLLATF